MMTVEFEKEGNRFFKNDENGRMIAEVTYRPVREDVIDINHTFVDPSLRGQGIAEKLVDRVVEEVEKEGKKIQPSCPYVVKLFDRKTDKYGHLQVK